MTTVHSRLNAYRAECMTRRRFGLDPNKRPDQNALDCLTNPLYQLVGGGIVISDEHWKCVESGLSTALTGSGAYDVEMHFMATRFALAAYINSVAVRD